MSKFWTVFITVILSGIELSYLIFVGFTLFSPIPWIVKTILVLVLFFLSFVLYGLIRNMFERVKEIEEELKDDLSQY